MEMDFELFAFAIETDAFHHKHMDMMHAGVSVGTWQGHLSGKIVKAYYKRHGRDYQFNRHDVLSAAHLCQAHYARQMSKVAA